MSLVESYPLNNSSFGSYPYNYSSFGSKAIVTTTTTVTNPPVVAHKKRFSFGRRNKGVKTTAAVATQPVLTTVQPGPGAVTTALPLTSTIATPIAAPIASPVATGGMVTTSLGDVVTTTSSNGPIVVQGPINSALPTTTAQISSVGRVPIQAAPLSIQSAPIQTTSFKEISNVGAPLERNRLESTVAGTQSFQNQGFQNQGFQNQGLNQGLNQGFQNQGLNQGLNQGFQNNLESSQMNWNQLGSYGWYNQGQQGSFAEAPLNATQLTGSSFNQPMASNLQGGFNQQASNSFDQSLATGYNQQKGSSFNQATDYSQQMGSSFNQPTGYNQQKGSSFNQATDYSQQKASSFNQSNYGAAGLGQQMGTSATSWNQPISNELGRATSQIAGNVESDIGRATSNLGQSAEKAFNPMQSIGQSSAPLGIGTR